MFKYARLVLLPFVGILPLFLSAPSWARLRALKFPSELNQTIERYTKAQSLHLTVRKSMRLAVLGRDKVQSGQIFVKAGNIRLEFNGSSKSLIVVGPKYIWIVNYPSKELGGRIQVARALRNDSRHPPVLYDLLARRNPSREFAVNSAKLDGSRGSYSLVARKRSPGIHKIDLVIDRIHHEILSLSYWDELGNKTTYVFLKTQWNPSLPDSLFRYIPPKGAAISHY